MAPRSRGRATQRANIVHRVDGISSLPDELLAKCLGFLPLRER